MREKEIKYLYDKILKLMTFDSGNLRKTLGKDKLYNYKYQEIRIHKLF